MKQFIDLGYRKAHEEWIVPGEQLAEAKIQSAQKRRVPRRSELRVKPWAEAMGHRVWEQSTCSSWSPTSLSHLAAGGPPGHMHPIPNTHPQTECPAPAQKQVEVKSWPVLLTNPLLECQQSGICQNILPQRSERLKRKPLCMLALGREALALGCMSQNSSNESVVPPTTTIQRRSSSFSEPPK